MVAAVVVFPPCSPALAGVLAPVRDSKLLSPRQRAVCYDLVVAQACGFGVGMVAASEIDRIGIVPATRKAMQQAIARLPTLPDYLLIDALPLPGIPIPQEPIIKGDRYCLSIAAASIIAKVTRDRWMVDLDAQLPGYGLARHKGYGTAQHLAALQRLGATPQHRQSFAPIRALTEADYG